MMTTPRTTKRRDFGLEVGPGSSRHNFSFNLTWGCHKQLRCVKHPELTLDTFNSDFRKRRSSSSDGDGGDDGGIDAMREKLMLDFRAEVHQLQAAFLNGGNHSVVAAETEAAAAAVEPRTWSLRTRRAVSKGPNNFSNGGDVCDRKTIVSPARNYDVKSPGKNGYGHSEVDRDEKGKRPKFSISLSKQEIEEDFVAMTGVRPARRPKKRAKAAQKQVDAMSPGFWLTEITADMYKVNEQLPDGGKR